jgi:hypothetical protein
MPFSTMWGLLEFPSANKALPTSFLILCSPPSFQRPHLLSGAGSQSPYPLILLITSYILYCIIFIILYSPLSWTLNLPLC